MERRDTLKIIEVLAIAGLLFSGYLTYYTFSSGRPGCELFFFGMPSCFYGLIMYALIFILSLSLAIKKSERSSRILAMTLLGGVGILFAGYLTIATLNLIGCTNLAIFGIPPCVYGLAMYILLLILALLELSSKR